AVARDPEDGREIEDRQDIAAKIPDAEDRAVRSRDRRQLAQFGNLDHVLDRNCVRLRPEADAHVNRAHDDTGAATPDSASPASARSSFLTRSSTLSAVARRPSCSTAS